MFRSNKFGFRGRRSDTRKLRFEPLESKEMMAGVVEIEVTRGTLSLQGDVSDNHVELVGTAVPGRFEIRGLHGTLLGKDGVVMDSMIVNNVTRDVVVELGRGSDVFLVRDAVLPGGLSIENHWGSDCNILVGVVVGGAIDVSRLRGAASASRLEIRSGTVVRGHVTIDNGIGDSMTRIDQSEIWGTVNVVNGSGLDKFCMTDSIVANSLEINNGAGVWGSYTILDGSSIGTAGFRSGRFSLRNDDGMDVVKILKTHVARGATIVNGKGHSEVLLAETVVGSHLGVTCGSGCDVVCVDDSTIRGRTTIATGNGVDMVHLLGASRFERDVLLDGGSGFDTLRTERSVAFDAVLAFWDFEILEGF